MADTDLLPLKLANMRSPEERNLCYINGLLQVLRNVPEFLDTLHQLNDPRLVESMMMDIFQYIGTDEIASAANLRFAEAKLSGHEHLLDGNQEDTMEFLTFMLPELSPELNNLLDHTMSVESRFVINGKPTVCNGCERAPDRTVEMGNYIELDWPDTPNDLDLGQMMNRNFQINYSGVGEGRRCVFCCKHGHSSDHKGDKKCRPKDYCCQRKLVKAPKILLIQAKRFSYDVQAHKKTNLITSPDNLTISQEHKYKQCGIVCHTGNTSVHGHYYAKVKKVDQWFICDDSNLPLPLTGNINDEDDYVFVYRKIEEEATQPILVPTKQWQEIPKGHALSDEFGFDCKLGIGTANMVRIPPHRWAEYNEKEDMKKKKREQDRKKDVDVKKNLTEWKEKAKQSSHGPKWSDLFKGQAVTVERQVRQKAETVKRVEPQYEALKKAEVERQLRQTTETIKRAQAKSETQRKAKIDRQMKKRADAVKKADDVKRAEAEAEAQRKAEVERQTRQRTETKKREEAEADAQRKALVERQLRHKAEYEKSKAELNKKRKLKWKCAERMLLLMIN